LGPIPIASPRHWWFQNATDPNLEPWAMKAAAIGGKIPRSTRIQENQWGKLGKWPKIKKVDGVISSYFKGDFPSWP